jgi:hypothetical protein
MPSHSTGAILDCPSIIPVLFHVPVASANMPRLHIAADAPALPVLTARVPPISGAVEGITGGRARPPAANSGGRGGSGAAVAP